MKEVTTELPFTVLVPSIVVYISLTHKNDLQDRLWPESLIFCRHMVLSASASASDFKLVRRVADDPYIAQRSETYISMSMNGL